MSTGAKGARMAARALLALIERPRTTTELATIMVAGEGAPPLHKSTTARFVAGLRAGGLPITVSRGPSALVSLDVGALP